VTLWDSGKQGAEDVAMDRWKISDQHGPASPGEVAAQNMGDSVSLGICMEAVRGSRASVNDAANRRGFCEPIGSRPYLEDRDMKKCEVDYNHRWKKQTDFLRAVSGLLHEGLLQPRSGAAPELQEDAVPPQGGALAATCQAFSRQTRQSRLPAGQSRGGGKCE